MYVYKLFTRTHTHTLTHTCTFIYVCSLYCIIMYYTSAMTFKTNAITYPQQLSSASNQEPIGIRVPPVPCVDHNPKSCRNISWYHLNVISVIKIGYPKEITCFIILHTNNDQAICAPIATSWGFLEILGFEFEKETANAAGSLEVWYWLAGTNLRITTGHIDSRNRWLALESNPSELSAIWMWSLITPTDVTWHSHRLSTNWTQSIEKYNGRRLDANIPTSNVCTCNWSRHFTLTLATEVTLPSPHHGTTAPWDHSTGFRAKSAHSSSNPGWVPHA